MRRLDEDHNVRTSFWKPDKAIRIALNKGKRLQKKYFEEQSIAYNIDVALKQRGEALKRDS
jgi:hypothetical protein